MILETERLSLREMTPDDRPAVAAILQDPRCMAAYEGAFTDAEADAWLANQFRRYREDGHGLWAVVKKDTGEVVGQCGLTLQQAPEGQVLEVGYLFNYDHWHNGYARESAAACIDYAFSALRADRVYAIIRDSNFASRRVALACGMNIRSLFTKIYKGVTMPHIAYAIEREDHMNFFDAMTNRHCYRGAYQNSPVAREELQKIMQAGIDAPSGCNTQTTSVVGIDDPKLMAQLLDVAPLKKFVDAPAAVIVLGEDLPGLKAGRWYVQDYAAAIENMLLTITALGYASCWVEGAITLDKEVNAQIRGILNIPEKYEIVAFLPVGIAKNPITPPEKKPFSERAWFNLEQ